MTTLTQEIVIDRIQQMCDVLRTNYQMQSVERHRKALEQENPIALAFPNGTLDDHRNYHRQQIDKLCEGEGLDSFVFTMGKKYAKIIHVTYHGKQRSAHAFVDLQTGDVYKSASWQAPAKGIRYNLLDDKSREEMYRRADWAGGYLYLR
jgi:hypothetical protein